MYVLSITYTAGADAVDAVRAEHMRWVGEQFAAGRFLASGAKVPRTGGVILARAMPRSELEELIAGDPFCVEGVAAYDVTEFAVTTTTDELSMLREG